MATTTTELQKQLEDAKSFVSDIKKARFCNVTRDALFAAAAEDAEKLADLNKVFNTKNGFQSVLVKYASIILRLVKTIALGSNPLGVLAGIVIDAVEDKVEEIALDAAKEKVEELVQAPKKTSKSKK